LKSNQYFQQAAAAYVAQAQAQQAQQKQFDDLNRAAMIQRFQVARQQQAVPQMGMVSVKFAQQK
jgi:hypothetical protein